MWPALYPCPALCLLSSKTVEQQNTPRNGFPSAWPNWLKKNSTGWLHFYSTPISLSEVWTRPSDEPSLLQSDRWSMASTLNEWPTSLICDELELDFATHRRLETSAKGWKVFLSGSDPGWLGALGQSAINVRYRTARTPPRSSCFSLGSQFLATASTLYLSLMGKLNIQPIKDGHVYLLQDWGLLRIDWIPLKAENNCW